MNPPLQFVTLTSGLRMGYVEVGPRNGVPVILLHGFPEFHYSFRLQWPALAQAGFRVIVPDQRGYNQTDKTPPYDLDTLARDIAQLQNALGIPRSHIVGHDWGGAMTYTFAHRYPERVDRLVVMNAPHINAYLDSVRGGNWAQMRKSWYVYAFQVPRLPEWRFARHNFAVLDEAFAGVKYMSADDVAHYKTAHRHPGALSAMIGWYRALVRGLARQRFQPAAETVTAPTLVIWGERDLALDTHINDTLRTYVPHARIEILPEASHWVQLDAPEQVNALLLDFLSRP